MPDLTGDAVPDLLIAALPADQVGPDTGVHDTSTNHCTDQYRQVVSKCTQELHLVCLNTGG